MESTRNAAVPYRINMVHESPQWHNVGAIITLNDAMAAIEPKKNVRTSVILSEEAHARIQALADANNVSAAWVIRAAVVRFLDEHGDQTELPLRLPKSKKARTP